MKPETLSFYELAVKRAVEHVVGNLDRALDLDGLAKLAALSPFHFHRIFRGLTGETPLEMHRLPVHMISNQAPSATRVAAPTVPCSALRACARPVFP